MSVGDSHGGGGAKKSHLPAPSGQSTRGTVTLRGDFVEQDADGRWIAEIPELPSVLVYGDSEDRAAQLARALAFRVLADQIEAGEVDASSLGLLSWTRVCWADR